MNKVPFYRQKPSSCASASLRTLAGFYGLELKKADVSTLLPISEEKGVFVLDVIGAARLVGLDVAVENANMEKLINLLNGGRPAIVMLEVSKPWLFWRSPKYHFVVVTGFSSEKRAFRVNDGYHEGRFIESKTFLRKWRKCNKWIMYVG